MNTQKKFIEQLELIAKRYRLEVINDASYSNIGTLRVQRFGDFRDIVTAHYNFQDGSAVITVASTEAACGFQGSLRFNCQQPSELQRVLDVVTRALHKAAPFYDDMEE